MNYKTNCNYEKETLEWDNYIPYDADKLIIGTFPTIKNRRSFEFFYPNKNNCFWLVLGNIANIEVIPAEEDEAIQNRKNILDKLKLGITDMGRIVLRHGNSSLDQSIFPIEFMDIGKILNENSNIKKLILTSSSGKNSVEGWLRSYCILNKIEFPRLKGRNPKRTKINFNKNSIDVVTVHSTSGAASRKFEELVKMYGKEIINN